MTSFSSTPRYTLPRRPLAPLPLHSISEESSTDYEEVVDINLGEESPTSILNEEPSILRTTPTLNSPEAEEDVWRRSGIAAHTNVPMRDRNWRSSSYARKRPRLVRESVDRDCGICFEIAVFPSRTLCCGNLFCLEHISEWLHGPDSEGRCPSCGVPCSLETDILSLASPVLKAPPPSPKTDMLSSSIPNSNSHQFPTPGDQSPIPRANSLEPIDLRPGDPMAETRKTIGVVKKVGKEGKNPLSLQGSQERATSSYSSSDEEVEKRRKDVLKIFYRRTSKFPLVYRYPPRPPTNSSLKVSPNVSPRDSVSILARRPQEVITFQLPLVGHELVVSYLLCEVLARTVGRLLSVVGLVILFWVLLT